MERSLIEQYATGADRLLTAVRKLSAVELRAFPIPGKWSVQQVVIHLADAEAAFADRIRRVLAEDNPTLLAWDENRFAANLHYMDQSADDAVTLIQLTRKQLALVLRKLPETAFDRAGQHSERGRQTVAEIIGKAVWHLDHHLKFINEKLAAMGKAA